MRLIMWPSLLCGRTLACFDTAMVRATPKRCGSYITHSSSLHSQCRHFAISLLVLAAGSAWPAAPPKTQIPREARMRGTTAALACAASILATLPLHAQGLADFGSFHVGG